MPIKTKTGIKLKTRAQRALDKENNPNEANKQTPKPTTIDRRKNYKPNKFSDRKYFNVAEDTEILTLFNSKKGAMSTRDISENLADKLGHSSESIRDRIKRYISKLSSLDEELLKEEAGLHPTFYAHFTHDKSRNRKSIIHFSAHQPKIAGSTLTVKEKKAIMKELCKKKLEKKRTIQGSPKKRKEILYTPNDIKQLKEEQEAKAEVYKVKLRKRSPRKRTKEINLDMLFPPIRKLKYVRVKNGDPHRNLETKVGNFLNQLGSKQQGDVECNAEILAEIIKSFAVTFSVEIDDIVDIIQKKEGPLNMESIRAQLMAKNGK